MPTDTMSFRFPPDLVDAIKAAAAATGTNTTEVATRILRRGLGMSATDALDTYLDTLTARSSE